MGLVGAPQAVRQLFIPSRFSFYNSVGGTAGSANGNFGAWAFPDAATGNANTIIDDAYLDSLGWSAFSITALHSNPNGTGGDAMMNLISREAAAGDNANSAAATNLFGPAVITAGAQNILVSTLLAASVAVLPTKLRSLVMSRDGAHLSDTLGGNWVLLGYRLGKV